MSEWFESLPEEEQNEWAVRAQLRAQRWLADQRDGYDAHEKNRKMLAAVVPRAKVCCYSRIEKGRRSMWSETEGGEPKRHFVCHRPGVRYVPLTGDWFCSEHDPLNQPMAPLERCCGRRDVEVCEARQGAWACAAGAVGHAWPHRFRRLEGGL